MSNLHLIDHPIFAHKLGVLRDVGTGSAEFRSLVVEISRALVYEASKDLVGGSVSISAPKGTAQVKKIQTWPTVIALMRSGIIMQNAVSELIPEAKFGHIGIYSDDDMNSTVEYFFKLPDTLAEGPIYLLDLLIGTGNTINAAISRLKECGARDIRLLTILASRGGLLNLQTTHPDVSVFAISVDEDDLTEKGFLEPGIGDIGQRLFNTK